LTDNRWEPLPPNFVRLSHPNLIKEKGLGISASGSVRKSGRPKPKKETRPRKSGQACLPVGREEYLERQKEVSQNKKKKEGEEPCPRDF
jgi:hypothetical protein